MCDVPGFDHVNCWIFDLDNTLYPAECRLFDQIDQRMGAFIANAFNISRAEARRVQKDYYFRYGTTLHGLMSEHGIDPELFLGYVHDIDHSVITRDRALERAISALPGESYVFTNGTVAHAENVLRQIGITHCFSGIFDIAASGYLPKPALASYEKFITAHDITAERAAMFEDIARNLKAPHDLGMTTVLVQGDGDLMQGPPGDDGADAAHVHHATENLSGFLAAIRS